MVPLIDVPLVKEYLFHSTCQARNGKVLKSRVGEICVKLICVNQGVVCMLGYQNNVLFAIGHVW